MKIQSDWSSSAFLNVTDDPVNPDRGMRAAIERHLDTASRGEGWDRER